MEYLSEEEFEAILDKAIEDLPAGVTDELDNVALFVEDAPEDGSPTPLGLYDGTPIGERGRVASRCPTRSSSTATTSSPTPRTVTTSARRSS